MPILDAMSAHLQGVAFDTFNAVWVGCGTWSTTLLARRFTGDDHKNSALREKLQKLVHVKKRMVIYASCVVFNGEDVHKKLHSTLWDTQIARRSKHTTPSPFDELPYKRAKANGTIGADSPLSQLSTSSDCTSHVSSQ